MIVVTCDLNSIPEPFSLLTCNCIALLIVAIIAACVKLIRIVCESRRAVVSRKAKKKQHACALLGLCDHYSELFIRMEALNF